MSSVTENVAALRARIMNAAAEAGRDGSAVRLVAATKMNGADAVREAIAAGVDACGENRVQEFTEKAAQDSYGVCPVHIIGHLQKNKVKYVVGKVALIESVDSLELMEAIDRRAAALGVIQDVLLEVNIGGEASKSGVSAEALPSLLCAAGDFPHLRVLGLMAIPPAASKPGENCVYFNRMYQLFIDIRAKKYDNISMTELSMGMSGDFEDAVRAGATMVRVGTAIFGPRNYDLQEAARNGSLR